MGTLTHREEGMGSGLGEGHRGELWMECKKKFKNKLKQILVLKFIEPGQQKPRYGNFREQVL